MKGIYLIQELGCLNPTSGAFQHIKMGIKHLGKEFEIMPYIGAYTLDINKIESEKLVKNNKVNHVNNRGHWLKGSVKDLIILLKTVCSIPLLYTSIKKEKPNFIYERMAYLNFAGLIISKLLGIPHFYEANGLQFQSKKKYYHSLFNPIVKYVEKQQYKNSTHTFFVGSYGNYWQLKSNNWTNVENGIEGEFITDAYPTKMSNGKRHLFFVGSLMQYHRPDILKEAILLLNPEQYHLHLVGSKLDNLYSDLLTNNIPVTHHGFINRSELNALISQFHIGIIAGSPEYQSCMKLFDYALAHCAIIAANVDVLKTSFNKELLFFEGGAFELANKINELINNDLLVKEYANSIYNKVTHEFTWENIFHYKSQVINKRL
ncbi:glycosyltransferase [Algibacter sp.]|nr:glycosyltransferase [Algibacter sp.]MDB4274065.1 glycosyltransferase [Algibacter sp.]